MARLPNQNKILPEDFPDEKFMPRLLAPINRFFEDVIRALNRNITLKENLAGDLLTIIDSGIYPLDIRWTRPDAPKVAWIGQCREAAGLHTNITTALYLDWEYTADGLFRINNIAGLSANAANKFKIDIVVLTG